MQNLNFYCAILLYIPYYFQYPRERKIDVFTMPFLSHKQTELQNKGLDFVSQIKGLYGPPLAYCFAFLLYTMKGSFILIKNRQVNVLLGEDSQDFLHKFVRFFVILGLKS